MNGTVARWALSLRSPLTILGSLAFLLVYILLFFLTDVNGLLLGIAIAYSLYAYAVWGYFLYTVIYEHRKPRSKNPVMPFVEYVLLYALTVLQNQCLYSAIALMSPDALVGIDSTTIPKWQVFYNSFFLAAETVAALGTGSIFASPFIRAAVGFIPVWLNSMQSLLYTGFGGPATIWRIHRIVQNVERRTKRPPQGKNPRKI